MPAPTPVNLRSGLVSVNSGHHVRVRTRSSWGAPWDLDEGIHCEQFTESINPIPNAAVITRREGTKILKDAVAPPDNFERIILPADLVGRQILIQIYDSAGAAPLRTWMGFAVSQFTKGDQDDNFTTRRYYQCYGLRYLLDRVRVTNSQFHDPEANVIRSSAKGISFNEDGNPNKHADGLQFARSNVVFWSTRSIVTYLLNQLSGEAWDFGNIGVELLSLPDWDKPVLPQHGRSISEMLDQLISRYRLLGWQVLPFDPDAPAFVDASNIRGRFNFFSHSESNIVLSGGRTIPENDTLYDVETFQSPKAVVDYSARYDHVVDRVILEGAPQVFIGTAADRSETTPLGNIELVPNWEIADELAYEEDGKDEAGYPASEDLTKQRNFIRSFRADEKFAAVFRQFKINAVDSINSEYIPYSRRVLPTTFLATNVDYTAAGPYPESNGTDRPAFAAIEIPDQEDKFIYTHEIRQDSASESESLKSPRKWNAVAKPVKNLSSVVDIKVSGFPQYVLGAGLVGDFGFEGLPEIDQEDNLGEWSWKSMVVTLAFEDDRCVQGAFPRLLPPWEPKKFYSAGEGPVAIIAPVTQGPYVQGEAYRVTSVQNRTSGDNFDAVELGFWLNQGPYLRPSESRALTISLGEAFQKTVLLPETIVGINPENQELLKSPNSIQALRDDTELLESLALLAYRYYATPRITFELEAPIYAESLKLRTGSMMGEWNGDKPINQIVSQITFSFAMIESDTAETTLPIASLRLQTAHAEFDPLRLI